MSIKYEPPQNIKFSYTDEETKENFRIEYNKNENNVIIIDKDEEAYQFPLLLFIEIIDFLKGNGFIKKAKDNNSFQPSIINTKGISVLPIPDISDNKDNSVAEMPEIAMVEFSDIDSIINFSPKVIIETPLISKEETEKTETEIKTEKEEIKKRPVLNGNMSSEQSQVVRGVGSEKNVIRRG